MRPEALAPACGERSAVGCSQLETIIAHGVTSAIACEGKYEPMCFALYWLAPGSGTGLASGQDYGAGMEEKLTLCITKGPGTA